MAYLVRLEIVRAPPHKGAQYFETGRVISLFEGGKPPGTCLVKRPRASPVQQEAGRDDPTSQHDHDRDDQKDPTLRSLRPRHGKTPS